MAAPVTTWPALYRAEHGPEALLKLIAQHGGIEAARRAVASTGVNPGSTNSWAKTARDAAVDLGQSWHDFSPQADPIPLELSATEEKDPLAEAVTEEAKLANAQRLLEVENRYLRKRVDHLERYYAHLDTVTRAAAGEFPYVKPKYPTPRNPKESWEEFVVFNLSDLQLGELIRTEETGGLETYTYAIMLKRIEHWKERVHLIVNEVLRRSIPIYNAGMVVGGDIGEGENVYRSQQAHIEFLLNEQIIKSVMALAGLMQFAAGLFENFWVWCVPGNHGMVEPTTLSLDLHVYALVRALLTRQENIHWSIAPNSFNLFQIGPRQFRHETHHHPRHQLAIHGSNLRSNLGTPNYAADRAYAKYSAMLNVVLDHLWIHHHHRLHVGQNWSINGAFPSGNDFSIDRMQGCDRPGQLMATIHQEVGWTSWRTIHLDDEPSLTPDADGQLSTVLPNDLGALVFTEDSG